MQDIKVMRVKASKIIMMLIESNRINQQLFLKPALVIDLLNAWEGTGPDRTGKGELVMLHSSSKIYYTTDLWRLLTLKAETS